MPQIVAHGGPKPAGRACAQCHLPSGDGHPESASLAGLPANYIIRQMNAFKRGERNNPRAGVMIAMAQVLSDDDIKAAAEYFARLKPTAGYNTVKETDTVPKSYVGAGGMRFADARRRDRADRRSASSCCPRTRPRQNCAIRIPASSTTCRGRHHPRPHVGHDRRQRQDRAVRRLPRPRSARHGRSAADHRPHRDLHVSPAQRHQERHARRHRGGIHEAGGREPLRQRHDRARRIFGVAQSVWRLHQSRRSDPARSRSDTRSRSSISAASRARGILRSRSSTPWRTASRARSSNAACNAATGSRCSPPTAPNISPPITASCAPASSRCR